MAKLVDAEGAGRSMTSPGWLTQLGRLWGGASDVPVADAKPEDIADLLGGALFKALYKWMEESGPVYLLPTGPISSFLVVSDPEAAKHVLRATDNPKNPIYDKGLVAEVSEFLFGDGFAISGGDAWRVRRRAVAPALHKGYLDEMVTKVFAPCAEQLNAKLAEAAAGRGAGSASVSASASASEATSPSSSSPPKPAPIDVEACFSQLTLDVIGKAVFNFDFDSLTRSSPVIQAVYTALKETESRATDVLPLWRLPRPIALLLSPRQRAAAEAVDLIRKTTEELVARCRAMVDAEAAGELDLGEAPPPLSSSSSSASASAESPSGGDPSVLRFLIAARDDVSSTQLRDDLLSMLVAGHETTGSVLTWTLHLLMQNPARMEQAVAEVDAALGILDPQTGEITKPLTASTLPELRYLMRCINESMRLYPHPPVLLRRARVKDELPGGFSVPRGQDVMISVYNIHRSREVWGETANDFDPMRFGPLDGPSPTEQSTDYRFIPFSGGARKCIGDQFALMEAIVALAVVLSRHRFEAVPGREELGMTTGATIHTLNGMWCYARERFPKSAARDKERKEKRESELVSASI